MDKIKKNKVVRAWVNRHVNDHYVHLAKQDGYRSRAAYKLLQLDQDDKILQNAKIIVDLGCAPGSWSQIALKRIAKPGLVVGVDLLQIDPIPGLNFIQGDFTESSVLNQLVNSLSGQKVDVVLSDMAPNLSGIKNVDQARCSYLVELVLDFAKDYLKSGGNCLIKVFHGGEFNNLMQSAKEIFSQVQVRKPSASRSDSSETYLLCKNKKI